MEKQYCEIHSFLDGEENCPDCNPSRVELPVMLRCQYCNKPIKELLDIDEDDETLRLPFCDEQCMEAYKEEHPEYFD